MGLPAADPSYVLEDLQQKLVVQLPYGAATKHWDAFLGIKLSQRTTQVMTRRMASFSESFRAAQPAPAAEADRILVMTVDGKGGPCAAPCHSG